MVAAGSRPLSSSNPTRSGRSLVLLGILVDLLAVLACALYASRLSRGMDVNFDQLSYHHYYSWLLLNGGPEQVDPEPFTNRYINPLAQLPWYFLDSLLSPRATAAAIGALAGLNLALVRRITMVVLEGHFGPVRLLALGTASMALAGVGAVFRLTLGTSLSDVVVALPMLGAVLAVAVAARETIGGRRSYLLVGLSGVLAGVAVGMKLTMGSFVLALILAVVYLAVVRRSVAPVAALAVGGLVGVAVSAGWWFYRVWVATGNPVFPYYNGVFRSSLWGSENFRDERYGPTSVLDALQFPLYMLQGTTRLLDYSIRDPRWVVLGAVILLAVALILLRRARKTGGRGSGHLPAAGVIVFVFFFVGGLAWLLQFGIARYAVTIELLSGAILVVLLVVVLRRASVAAALAVVAALAMAPFTRGATEHVPFQADRYGIDAAPLRAIPQGSLVLVNAYSGPAGFLLPEVPAGVRRHIVHPWFFGSPLLEQLKREEIEKAPRILVVMSGAWPANNPVYTQFEKFVGVRIDQTSCVTIRSHVAPRRLCDGVWVGEGPGSAGADTSAPARS